VEVNIYGFVNINTIHNLTRFYLVKYLSYNVYQFIRQICSPQKSLQVEFWWLVQSCGDIGKKQEKKRVDMYLFIYIYIYLYRALLAQCTRTGQV